MAFVPIRLEPIKQLRVGELLDAKLTDRSAEITIRCHHKTKKDFGYAAPAVPLDLYRQLCAFALVHKAHFQCSTEEQWRKMPLFATDKKTAVKNISAVVSRTSKRACGRPLTNNDFRFVFVMTDLPCIE